jgi:N-methylhydantoinase A
MVSVGFDIGGTFTDLAMVDEESASWRFFKLRTTPEDRAAACLDGISTLLAAASAEASAIRYVAHGTTIATNTIIERNGAKTALITTGGVVDVLEIRRQVMPHRYDVRVLKPEPLVPRIRRHGVTERVLSDGSVETALDEEELRELLITLKSQGVESLAISFLHSYANPNNEDRAAALAKAEGDWYVCASHDVLNEFREYERTSTAVANAYVAPPMQRYLNRLQRGLEKELGVGAPLLVFQSNGGVAPAAQAGALPIASVLSGPAAGVMAGCALAQDRGATDFVSLDMGGTSCDVALVRDGQPAFAYEQEIGGWPVRTPRLDIHTVGAGGGSIAWQDRGGLLHVGPQSAGAEPGPACYGRGGASPTVTDANLILGRLNSRHLLGGRMPVDQELAARVIDDLGASLGLDRTQTAAGILNVVNSTMVRAIRVVSVERGFHPQDFSLLAFGGAGPLHACELARELGMREIVVPPYPGVLCALGLLISDLRVDGSLTRRLRLDETDVTEVQETFRRVERDLRGSVAVEKYADAPWEASYSLDMRYVGQSFELPVPVAAQQFTKAGWDVLSAAFDEAHKRVYDFATPTAGKEIVCFRVSLRAPAGVGAGSLPRYPYDGDGVRPGVRPVFFGEIGWIEECPVYERQFLPPGSRIEGPAIIEQMDTTTLVTPDFVALIEENTNIVMRPL